MRKSEQIKIIREAYSELDRLGLQDGFHDVSERLYDMNLAAERRHRRGGLGHPPSPLSVKDAAKLFTVKHLLDAFKEPDRFTVNDILNIRTEVLYAQAYVQRHYIKFATWAPKWAEKFEEVDYAELMTGGQ